MHAGMREFPGGGDDRHGHVVYTLDVHVGLSLHDVPIRISGSGRFRRPFRVSPALTFAGLQSPKSGSRDLPDAAQILAPAVLAGRFHSG